MPFLQPAPCGSKRTVKVHVLCPPSHHFDIIRKEQRQCFEDIWDVVHEKEKLEWAYQGALRNTTVHWNSPRVLSIDLYSRDPSRRVCFNPLCGDINKAEGLHFRHTKSVVDGVYKSTFISTEWYHPLFVLHFLLSDCLQKVVVGWCYFVYPYKLLDFTN